MKSILRAFRAKRDKKSAAQRKSHESRIARAAYLENPDDSGVVLRYAKHLKAEGRTEEAAAVMQAGAQNQATALAVLCSLAKVGIEKGDFNEALRRIDAIRHLSDPESGNLAAIASVRSAARATRRGHRSRTAP